MRNPFMFARAPRICRSRSLRRLVRRWAGRPGDASHRRRHGRDGTPRESSADRSRRSGEETLLRRRRDAFHPRPLGGSGSAVRGRRGAEGPIRPDSRLPLTRGRDAQSRPLERGVREGPNHPSERRVRGALRAGRARREESRRRPLDKCDRDAIRARRAARQRREERAEARRVAQRREGPARARRAARAEVRRARADMRPTRREAEERSSAAPEESRGGSSGGGSSGGGSGGGSSRFACGPGDIHGDGDGRCNE